tara:strand:- start:10 stop:420 length:411 start_codon:yes stop_codon:yes gene_type:complete
MLLPIEEKKECTVTMASALCAAMVQKEDDHEMALLINKTFEYDKAEQLRVDAEEREIILQGAKEQSEECQRLRNETMKQNQINEENARLANKEHCSFINNEILHLLVEVSGITNDQAKAIVIAIAKNKIPNTTINY